MTHDERGPLRRITGVLGGIWKERLWARGLRESLAADTWSPDQIQSHYDAQLTRIVKIAAAKIPYYREAYQQANVDLPGFRGAADLTTLPTISKAELLEAGRRMVNPRVPGLAIVRHTTGGSTGTVGTMFAPRGIASWEEGCIHALWRRVGLKRGDPIVTLRGALLDGGRRLSEYDRSTNRLTISTYHLSDENVSEIIRLIDDFKPTWLHVYASAAALLANVLRRTGQHLQTQPRAVLCGSEAVSDWHVDLFRDVFGCRTYSHYGHGELALLGGWCEHTTAYHFLPNHGYLELLDDNQQPITEPGIVGEITGTGFFNTVMPLIRYRTADYGVWDEPGPCPACGRHHQRLARIEGRIQEYLTLTDGTRFPATNINALHGMFFALIYRFQFVQRRPGHATLRYVPAVELTAEQEAEIRSAFAFLAELGLTLDYEAVSEIPLTRSGKQRIVISEEESAR